MRVRGPIAPALRSASELVTERNAPAPRVVEVCFNEAKGGAAVVAGNRNALLGQIIDSEPKGNVVGRKRERCARIDDGVFRRLQ